MSEKESNTSYKSGVSAGELLRSARESLGLTIDETASRLCLSASYIDQIERDDYSHFAARTYARGYVISYARLLNVPDDKILPAFASVASQFDLSKNTIVNASSLKTENAVPIYQDEDRQHHSNFIWWVSAFIILLLAGLVVMWAQGPRGADKNPAGSMVSSVSSTVMPLQGDDGASNSSNGSGQSAPASSDSAQNSAANSGGGASAQSPPANESQSAANTGNNNAGNPPAAQRGGSVSANNNNVSLPAPQQTAND